MDNRTSTNPSSALADPKTRLQYIIADSPDDTITEQRRSERTADKDVRIPGYILGEPTSISATSTSRKRKEPLLGSAQNSSIYNGNIVKALKKDNGKPLWRKDIQYDFLKAVCEDRKAAFTNSYQSDQITKQTFAYLYIDTMARSSMTSKILRDKLLGKHESAKNMAMVCLLVNIGRMNTTLNCEFHLLGSYLY
jgi:Ino eighty subunit 1